MISFLYFALVSCQFQLFGKSTGRQKLAPANFIKAHYEAFDSISGSLATAMFDIETHRPALNLLNFKEISSIDCKDLKGIRIHWNTREMALDAFKAWSPLQDLALYFQHEMNCGQSHVMSASVNSISYQDSVILIDATELKLEKVVKVFELELTKKVVANHAHIPIRLNYDVNTGQAANPQISLGEYQMFQGFCVGCKANGTIDIDFKLRGSFTKLLTYSLLIDGLVDANIDLQLVLSNLGNLPVFRKRLFEHVFSVISIFGILSIDPLAFLESGVSFNLAVPGKIQIGADLRLPIHFKSGSNNGILGKPLGQFSGTPIIRPHKPSFQGPELIINLHLIPAFSIRCKIFQITAFHLDFELNNELQVVEKFKSECLNTGLARRHEVGFGAAIGIIDFNRHVTVYDSGYLKINCTFCDQCARSTTQ